MSLSLGEQAACLPCRSPCPGRRGQWSSCPSGRPRPPVLCFSRKPSTVGRTRLEYGRMHHDHRHYHRREHQHEHHLASVVLSGFLARYWASNPLCSEVASELQEWMRGSLSTIDHLAFRTLGVPGMDIASLSEAVFLPLGWIPSREVLEFPKKKIWARWFSPPSPDLPRIFISQLKPQELSASCQHLLEEYLQGDVVCRIAPYTGMLNSPPWATPKLNDYKKLAAESEYAAWVMLHGFKVNHAAIAVHRLRDFNGGIEELNHVLLSAGFRLNDKGGQLKISDDGLLLQSSTVADVWQYEFADGQIKSVPGSYIEFTERRVLPEYEHLSKDQITEYMLRDGFEVSNADNIFESTTVAIMRL